MHEHNLSFGLGATFQSGDAVRALRFAHEMQSGFPPGDLVSARAYLALGRYMPVFDALALQRPKEAFPAAFYHFARGEAFAREGDAQQVLVQAGAIATLRVQGFTERYEREAVMFEVARLTLVGRAAMLRRDWPTAIKAYRKAVTSAEANEPYADPPLWPWSPRRSLAEALLKSGNRGGARREARLALRRWPEDGIALYVLTRASQGPAKARLLARARKAWMGPKDLLRPAMI